MSLCNMKYILLPETGSTNTYAKANAAAIMAEGQMPVCIRTDRQIGGRGQRGNSWEAAPGKNLTLSLMFRPEGLRPAQQFSISEAVALGVCDLLAEHGIAAKIKWPNDIYVADSKIAGILIEHSLMGTGFQYTIAGIGLNVNQTTFLSDAPNPVSMAQLTAPATEYNPYEESAFGSYAATATDLAAAFGADPYDLSALNASLCDAVMARMQHITTDAGRDRLHADFMDALWRNDGAYHTFRNMLPGHPADTFQARITAVDPSGHLRLATPEGATHIFAFKEVAWL